jgi:hypothetical protein
MADGVSRTVGPVDVPKGDHNCLVTSEFLTRLFSEVSTSRYERSGGNGRNAREGFADDW